MYEVSDEYMSIMNREFRNPGHVRISMYINGSETATVFNDGDVLESSCKRSFARYGLDLPTVEIFFTIADYDNQYDADDENSPVYTMTSQTKIILEYGLSLDDDSIEWLQMGTCYLSSVEAGKSQVTFKAVDSLRGLSEVYRGSVSTLGSSDVSRALYQKYTSLLNDTGIVVEGANNLLDITDDYTYLPDVPLKQSLQLLAGAAVCSLRIDRYDELSMTPDDVGIPSGTTELDYLLKAKSAMGDVKIDRQTPYPNARVVYHHSFEASELTDSGVVSPAIAGIDTNYNFEANTTFDLPASSPVYEYITTTVDGYDIQFDPEAQRLLRFERNGPTVFRYTALQSGTHRIMMFGSTVTDSVNEVSTSTDATINTTESNAIDNPQMSFIGANRLSAALATYENPRVLYTLSTRGEPEIDPGDFIWQFPANKTDDAPWVVQVLSNKVSFNGAFRGELITQRICRSTVPVPAGYAFSLIDWVTDKVLSAALASEGYQLELSLPDLKERRTLINTSRFSSPLMQVRNGVLLLD